LLYLNKKTHTKQAKVEKHKIRIIACGGRTSEILPKEGVCLSIFEAKADFEI